MRQTKNDRITIRLTREEMRMLDQMSFDMDLSVSEVIRLTIENYYQYFKLTH